MSNSKVSGTVNHPFQVWAQKNKGPELWDDSAKSCLRLNDLVSNMPERIVLMKSGHLINEPQLVFRLSAV